MTRRENLLRAIRFEKPDYIPVSVGVSGSVFSSYTRTELEEIFGSHPLLGGLNRIDYGALEKSERGETEHTSIYTDEFGVEWEGAIYGIRGVVQKHPLADFSKIRDYRFPELPKFDSESTRKHIETLKNNGQFTSASLEHGHTFLRLTDLCGYENVLYGMADEDEDLMLLIKKLEEYNSAFTDHWSKCGYDMVGFPEDLGMQVGPMISPEYFRKYIKPSYSRMMKPVRDSGAIIHMHSDGDIRTLAPDLVDGGVDVLNLQDLVNGIDWIKDNYAGKLCVELDIDRQNVTVFGTPADVDALIREEVEKLSSPMGGLMMIYGWYAGTPIKNVDALLTALEKYMYYWS